MIDVDSPAARALRELQKFDQVQPTVHRWRLIAAETALGEALGLECTGVADSFNEDGSPAGYDHSGDTCPIHEWLVPEDHEEVADAG